MGRNYTKPNKEFLITALTGCQKHKETCQLALQSINDDSVTIAISILQEVCPSEIYLLDTTYACNSNCKAHWESIIMGRHKVMGINLEQAICDSVMKALSLAPDIQMNASDIRINIYNVGEKNQSARMDYEPKAKNANQIICEYKEELK